MQTNNPTDLNKVFAAGLKPQTSPLPDSGERQEFESGAVRDMSTGKGRCDLLPPHPIIRLSIHYEKGAEKYGERNWEKGIPSSSYLNSAIRHLLNYSEGSGGEDHLAAVVFNVFGLMENERKTEEE